MNVIELRINGRLLELDNNVSIKMTKAFSDLTNPAAIKNSFSQTIKIPSTPTNDEIFTHIWRLDHIKTTFDPSKRVDFILSINGAVFEDGYMKLNSIDYSNLKDRLPDYYNVHLYGGLGDFFYNLSEKYMSDLSVQNNFSHRIDRDTVWASYNNDSYFPYNVYMKYTALNIGHYDNFENDRVFIGNLNAEGNLDFIDLNDRDQWQRRELRTYYQRPAIYINYLINQIFSQSGYTVSADTSFFNTSNPYWSNVFVVCPAYNTADANDGSAIRSYSTVTFKDMMGDENINQLDFMLSYLKAFGLIFKKNTITNQIQIQTRETHFANYEIVDWTYKLDYSKTYNNRPLPFDFRYATLKWTDSNTYYEEFYKNKYGRSYAQYRANTGWEFDDKENNLLDGNIFRNVAASREIDSYFARWENFGETASAESIAGDQLALFEKSNRNRENSKDGFTLSIYEGTKLTQSAGEVKQFYLSDDDNTHLTPEETYCWEYNSLRIEPRNDSTNSHAPDAGRLVNTIPSFVRRSNTHSLDFAVPEEEYIIPKVYDPNSTISNRYWSYYLQERYNVDNHVLTAYFYLTTSEVQEWDFTKFVRIYDVLYFVNKIEQFDITGESSTKCELIRVQDIDRYINLVDYTMSINPGGSTFRYVGGSGVTYVNSNLPPTVSTSVSWITADPPVWNGTNYTCNFQVAENPFTSTRIGYIYYTNGRNTVVYQVTQLGYPYVTVTPTSQTTDVTAKTVTFTVTSNYPVNIEE